MEHDWVMQLYRGNPENKCLNCGFIWKQNMKTPKATCDEIIATNRRKSPKD